MKVQLTFRFPNFGKCRATSAIFTLLSDGCRSGVSARVHKVRILNEDLAVVIDLLPPWSGLSQPPDRRQLRAKFLRHRRKIDQILSDSKVDDEVVSEQKLCICGYQ
ncbi:hypothetical protein HFO50_22545 [Rhizobium leguminosarum]|uniref:hypothetical protein n=1 Tax=Rhizobium leguminosarum TaxID=384 RepID=UPI001C96A127|nr:hypothetical protein [Rhizobium leguminosarum]MBY5603915.1 hypothetical protein [Rhizobium leguminosarum]